MKNKRWLEPPAFHEVSFDDRFWAPRLAVNTRATIPAIYRHLKGTGRIDAFDLDWKPGAPHRPHIFWDSDVAKWIEGMSYAQA